MTEKRLRNYHLHTAEIQHPYLSDPKHPTMWVKESPFRVVKADELGQVEAIVNVFGIFDGMDIVQSGSFTKSITERFKKIRVLDQHKLDSVGRIVAQPLRIYEVGRADLPAEIIREYPEATGGLYTVSQYFMEDEHSRAVYNRAKRDVLEWSIGFDPLEFRHEKITLEDGSSVNARVLMVNRLWEFSAVIWGMNPATVTVETYGQNRPVIIHNTGEERTMRTEQKAQGDAPNYVAATAGNPETCATCKHFQEMSANGGHCTLYDFEADPDYRCDMYAPGAVVPLSAGGPEIPKSLQEWASKHQIKADAFADFPGLKELTGEGPVSRFGDYMCGRGFSVMSLVLEDALKDGNLDFNEFEQMQDRLRECIRSLRNALPNDLALRPRRGMMDYFFMFEGNPRFEALSADDQAKFKGLFSEQWRKSESVAETTRETAPVNRPEAGPRKSAPTLDDVKAKRQSLDNLRSVRNASTS